MTARPKYLAFVAALHALCHEHAMHLDCNQEGELVATDLDPGEDPTCTIVDDGDGRTL